MEVETGRDFQTIIIKKSYDQLERDLKSILLFEKPLKASDIQQLWTNYLEFTVEPVGWKAVWKMSRDACQRFGVGLPVVAAVMVNNVNYDMLTADVSVTYLEEDLAESSIPDLVDDIPLIQLYPTIEQHCDSLNISQTADSLECLRIFYRHLWYPWDVEDDSGSWVQDHLENRLKLHFDITSRNIPRDVLAKINNLVEKGNYIHKKIQELSELVENNETDVILAQNVVELNCIKEHLNLFEMKEIRDKIDLHDKVDQNGKVFLAWLDGISDDLWSVLQRIKSQLPDDKTSFSCLPSLEKLFDECWGAKNIVYVGEGRHCLKRSCDLSSEIIIQGVGAASKTLIENSEGGRLLFNIMSQSSSFSDLCLVGSKLKFVVIVRTGCCRMSNVTVQGSHANVAAVLVQSGAEFYAESCTFTDCSVAVEARGGSKITLKDCVIQNNMNGLVFQSSNVNLENCHFIDNTHSAVVQLSGSESVSGKSLESLQGVTAKGITFSGNKVNISNTINNDPL